jgi:hypothetical protein
MACLLAIWVACCWWGEEAAEGLVLSLVVGDSVALLEVAARCDGLEAELGDVSWGIVCDWAITTPAGASEIRAANISVLRVVIYLSRIR